MGGDERISDLLLRWEELREHGRSISAEQLCQDCPELIDEVRQAIEAVAAIYRVRNSPSLTTDSQPRDHERTSRAKLPNIAGYEILGELGSGGMGVVYKARHTQLKRDVAIKMIRAGAHAGTRELARFRIEAEAAARLQHPNIVQIHEIIEQDGCPFLILEFVDGPSLAATLRNGPLAPRIAAELTRSLARAVHFAHQRHIVHRDLKPANVLLHAGKREPPSSPSSGVPIRSAVDTTCIPKIADFGLAKLLDAEVSHTHTGAVMGSPGYMAPEQADGRTQDIGPASDVYALGAILYEMLTGRPPFAATTLLETLDLVRTQEPIPPTRLNQDTPRDLETICLKCLEKEPQRRYESAAALAEDLDRFTNGELILARSFGVADRLTRTLTRAPGSGKLRTVSDRLLLLSPIPFVSNLLVFVLVLMESRFVDAAIALMVCMAPTTTTILFLTSRWRADSPMNMLERQFWSIWTGAPLGMVILYLAQHRPATLENPFDLSGDRDYPRSRLFRNGKQLLGWNVCGGNPLLRVGDLDAVQSSMGSLGVRFSAKRDNHRHHLACQEEAGCNGTAVTTPMPGRFSAGGFDWYAFRSRRNSWDRQRGGAVIVSSTSASHCPRQNPAWLARRIVRYLVNAVDHSQKPNEPPGIPKGGWGGRLV